MATRTDGLQEDCMQAGSRVPSEHGDDEETVPTNGRYVHPEAARMFSVVPCTRKLSVFSKATESYGPRCVTALGLCYFFNKGLGNNIMTAARAPMFLNYFGLEATRYQRLSGISKMGWSVKAFSASLSDMFACAGYTKRWYCAASCIVGGAFTLGYALLPGKPSSADMAAGFVFLGCFCMANVDILSEGHYSRLMRKYPDAGPALVSWIWWFILAAGIVAYALMGPLADAGKPQVGLYISAASQAVAVLFFIFNWYGEKINRIERVEDARQLHEEAKRALAAAGAGGSDSDVSPFGEKDMHPEKNMHPEAQSDEEGAEARQNHLSDELASHNAEAFVVADTIDDEEEEGFVEPDIQSCMCGFFEINKEVIHRNWKILVYSAVMVCSVVAMTCVTIMGTTWDLLYCAVAVAVVDCGMAFWACPLVVAKAIVFAYLHMLFYLQIPGATDGFYLAKEECLPDGPHFTYVFYSTIAAIIGNVGGIAGVTAFNYIFSKQSYCVTFIATTSVQVLASIFDIIMVKRWNIYIGIPDHAMYLFGDAIVYEVCYMLAWMPLVVLLSRICPRGSESMVYALAAGFSNMGQSMSATIGSILMEKVWPVVSKGVGTCDFHNVPILLVVGHLCMPLLNIPMSFLLLPRARICDDIDEDGNAIRRNVVPPARAEKAATEETGGLLNEEPAGERENHSGRKA